MRALLVWFEPVSRLVAPLVPDVSPLIDVSWAMPVSIWVLVEPGAAGCPTAPADVSLMFPELPAFRPPEHAATSNVAATSGMYLMFRSSTKWVWAENPAQPC